MRQQWHFPILMNRETECQHGMCPDPELSVWVTSSIPPTWATIRTLMPSSMCSAPLTNGLCHRADRCQGFPNRLSNWNPRARSKWWRKQWADKSANKLPLRGQNAKDYVGSRNYLKRRIWVHDQSQILGIYYLIISNRRKRKAPQLCLPTKMERTQLLLFMI